MILNIPRKKTVGKSSKNFLRFFVSCPIGAEIALRRELFEILPHLREANGHPLLWSAETIDLQTEAGGIELSLPLVAGLQLNFWCRIGHRVLLRLDQARSVTNFGVLKKWAATWSHRKYIGTALPVLKVSSENSRLYHEGAIHRDLLALGIIAADTGATSAASNGKAAVGEAGCQTLLLRLVKDRATLSLDTTGEHLHRRGWAQMKGGGPLRENLAAFLLQSLIASSGDAADQHAPPWSALGKVTLLDPCAGSGTFLTEAMTMGVPLVGRSFAFDRWANLPEFLRNRKNFRPLLAKNQRTFASMVGIEKDPHEGAALVNNLWGLHRILGLAPTPFNIHICDFQALPLVYGGAPDVPPARTPETWVISNPPYGERLQRNFSWQDLFKSLQSWSALSPQPITRCGVLHLSNAKRAKSSGSFGDSLPREAFGFRLVEEIPFKNGGLEVTFSIWQANVPRNA